MKRNYRTELLSLEENLEILKGELYIFRTKVTKKSAKRARAALLNIRKICQCMRLQILAEVKVLPKEKRTHTPESIAAAKQKRMATNARKKLESRSR